MMIRARCLVLVCLCASTLFGQEAEDPYVLDEVGWESLMVGLRVQDPAAEPVCALCGPGPPCIEALADNPPDSLKELILMATAGDTLRLSIPELPEETPPWTFHWYAEDHGRKIATAFGQGPHAVCTSTRHGSVLIYGLAQREEEDEDGETKTVRALCIWDVQFQR